MRNIFKKAISMVTAVALFVGVAVPSQNAQAAKKVSIDKTAKVTVGKTVKINLKNNKKRVIWKITTTKGKKLIKITKKAKTYVKVKGKKKGTAKVQAVIGKKKYTCKVTVAAKKKVEATKAPAPTPIPSPSAKPTETPPTTSIPSNMKVIEYDGATDSKNEIRDAEKEGVLYKVVVKDSMTGIGYEAFSGCSSLTSIEIPDSVMSIGYGVFSGCSNLAEIVVSENNLVYDSRNNCNAIIETDSNTLVVGCQDTRIPDSVTSIGGEAFSGYSSLTSIEIPDSVTSIGYEAFSGCSSLTSIEIPDSVTSGVETAFSDCSSLTEIVVSEDNLVYDSRNNCNAIIETDSNTLVVGCQNTRIPDSVTSIGYEAFSDCSNLEKIIWNGTVYTSVDSFENAFGGFQ